MVESCNGKKSNISLKRDVVLFKSRKYFISVGNGFCVFHLKSVWFLFSLWRLFSFIVDFDINTPFLSRRYFYCGSVENNFFLFIYIVFVFRLSAYIHYRLYLCIAVLRNRFARNDFFVQFILKSFVILICASFGLFVVYVDDFDFFGHILFQLESNKQTKWYTVNVFVFFYCYTVCECVTRAVSFPLTF